MYGMARTRARRNQDRQNAARHKDWMDNWRSNPENLKAELKARVLNRVKKGSIPNVSSMARYDITLEEVNLLRAEYGYEPLIINVPMFLRERECGDIEGRVADNIPARSAVVEDIDQREDEVEQPRRRTPLPTRPTPESVRQETEQLERRLTTAPKGKTDTPTLNLYMRWNPTPASQKRSEPVKRGTLDKQYGNKKADTDSGMFPRFMEYLGKQYYDDVRKVYNPAGIKYIKKRLYEPRENTKLKDGITYRGGSRFMALKTTQQQFETLLKVLRHHPEFDALNTRNRVLREGYDELDRFNTELKAIGDSESIVSKDEKAPVLAWDEIVKKVFNKYPAGTKERLYIQMYGQFPSRDDFGSLWVDDTDTDIPQTDKEAAELVRKNTLFIPNTRRRKAEKRAVFVLKDYKTSSIYGTRRFEFSPELTKEILKYVKKNKITGPNRVPYIFGSGAMSTWVGKLLDSIGVERQKANINYLRRSYVSTELDKEGITPEQRVKLAWDMKHSPAGSLKYWRNLVAKEPDLVINEENINKANKIKKVDGS